MATTRPVWHNLWPLHENIGNLPLIQGLSDKELADCKTLATEITLNDFNDVTLRNVWNVWTAINREIDRRAVWKNP